MPASIWTDAFCSPVVKASGLFCVEPTSFNGKPQATAFHSCRLAFGFTPDGRYILVVFEQIDKMTVYPVTAYEVEEKHGNGAR